MTSKEAVRIIYSFINNEPVVVATGYLSRSAQEARDRDLNFYVIGSMGMVASIAGGIALAKPSQKVIALDGDGAVLMNLGALPTAAALKIKNLVHIVIDNGSYESTGAQVTFTNNVKLEAIAKASGYRFTKRVTTPAALRKEMPRALRFTGPSFLLVRVENDKSAPAPRIQTGPEEITRRFSKCLK